MFQPSSTNNSGSHDKNITGSHDKNVTESHDKNITGSHDKNITGSHEKILLEVMINVNNTCVCSTFYKISAVVKVKTDIASITASPIGVARPSQLMLLF